MSLSDFDVVKRLGEGAYSSVYQVKRLADGDIYALKKVKMIKLSDKEKENALNEVRILASIQHRNICSYKEAFIDEPSSSLCIVMEYSDNGDLFQKITTHQKQQQYISEDLIWKIFIQIVRGLKALHEIKIFHRDLKSANIFLHKDGTAKLGDMNVSKVAKKGLLYTQTGTPYYASPEVWRDLPYDHKSDIWSLGCVLYESVTLKPPFRAEDMQGLYKKVLRGIYPKIPSIFSQELGQTIKLLVQVAPHMRPSCEKILDLPIVRKKIEKLFPEDFFEENPETNLLSTIRVPKNLLYLTDRLPKPQYYDSDDRRRREQEELLRRRTYEGSQQHHLPDVTSNAGSGSIGASYKEKRRQIIQDNGSMLDGSQGGSVGTSSQAPTSVKKQKQSKRNQSIKDTQATASLSQAYAAESSPNINYQDQVENKKNRKDPESGSQVRVPRKPLHQVDSSASVPVVNDEESQNNSSRAPGGVRASGNADRKVSKDGKRKSSINNDAAAPQASGTAETRKSSVAMRNSQPKVAKRTSPTHGQPVAQVDDADEYSNDDFEAAGTAQKPAGGRRTSQHKETSDDGDRAVHDSNQKGAANVGSTGQSGKKKPAALKNVSKQRQAVNAQQAVATPVSGQVDLTYQPTPQNAHPSASQQVLSSGAASPVRHRKPQSKVVEPRGLAHNPSKENLTGDAQSAQYDAYDTPGSNAAVNQAARRKPPIHKQNRKNMDLYNPAVQNDVQSLLPHISSSGDLIGQSSSVGAASRHQQYHGHGRAGQNMAYVNISQEGNKPVGPIGLKRAEKELIMRRYKNAYHGQHGNVDRVALIYGQQHPVYNSNDRQYLGDGASGLGLGNRGSGIGSGYYMSGANAGGNGSYQSPYLVSVAGDGLANQRNSHNAIGVVRRGKNYLEDMKNQNSGYQVRLPKLTNQNRLNHDYIVNQMRRNAQQGVLPPLVAGQSMGTGAQGGGLSSATSNAGSNYQAYGGYRPSKLKSLVNKHMVGGQHPNGLSGEKIRLNQYNSHDRLGGSVNASPAGGDPSYLIQGSYHHQQQYLDQQLGQLQHVPSGAALNERGSRKVQGSSKLGIAHGGNSAIRRHAAPGGNQGGSAADRHGVRVPSNQRGRVGGLQASGSALESANQRLSNQANGGSALGGASIASANAERSPLHGKKGPLVASSKLQMANLRGAANNSNQSTKENSVPPAPVAGSSGAKAQKIGAD